MHKDCHNARFYFFNDLSGGVGSNRWFWCGYHDIGFDFFSMLSGESWTVSIYIWATIMLDSICWIFWVVETYQTDGSDRHMGYPDTGFDILLLIFLEIWENYLCFFILYVWMCLMFCILIWFLLLYGKNFIFLQHLMRKIMFLDYLFQNVNIVSV